MFSKRALKLNSELNIQNGKFINLTAGYSDTETSLPIMLVFHGLSSDSNLTAWWDKFDWLEISKNFRVICINSLGSAFGSTGPNNFTFINNINIESKSFPEITISDSVNFTLLALKELGINSVDTVFGCSLGGMQTLDLYLRYPDFAKTFISTCASELPPIVKLYNLAQINSLQESIDSQDNLRIKYSYKYARYFFRLSCTTNKAIISFEKKLLLENNIEKNTSVAACHKYYLNDGTKYTTEFPVLSYVSIMNMITNFSLSVLKNKATIIKSKIHLIGISGDLFTPSENVKSLYQSLLDYGHNAEYHQFETIYGHESWIIDGKNFYEFYKKYIT